MCASYLCEITLMFAILFILKEVRLHTSYPQILPRCKPLNDNECYAMQNRVQANRRHVGVNIQDTTSLQVFVP